MNNHEREELIVGARSGALDADAAADVPLLAELLGDQSMWAEPSEDLEDAVVAAVSAAEAAPVRNGWRTAAGPSATLERQPVGARDPRGRGGRRRRRRPRGRGVTGNG